ISLAIEKDLLSQFDQWLNATGQPSRSEAVRDLIRTRLSEAQSPDETMKVGSLTLLYDHTRRGLSHHLNEEGHAHTDMVLSTLHIHLDAHLCLEIMALRGSDAALRHFASHLIGAKGVLHGGLTLYEPHSV